MNNKKKSAVGAATPATENKNHYTDSIAQNSGKIKTPLKVLVACEESQRVCMAFRKLGHEAYSCDIQEPSGEHPEWHLKADVLRYINPCTGINGILPFLTMDGKSHFISGKWDLIIAHPPCTYPRKGVLNQERYAKGLQAKEFFLKLYNADCEHIAVENPIPSKVYEMPPYTQIIQPYEYGEPYSKKTCLWLKGLPKLTPTNVLTDYKPYVSCGTSVNKGNPNKSGVSRAGGAAKIRSKTFWGIARAMAEQWGGAVNG